MGDEYYVLKVGHIYTPYVEGKALWSGGSYVCMAYVLCKSLMK
jgi:hypothetical protein